MEIFLLWVLFAIGVGALANSRGRSGVGFFLLSAVLSPLVGLIVVLVMSDLKAEAAKERLRKEDHERELESIRVLAKVSSSDNSAQTGPSKFIGDELLKLAALRDKGILTEQEFQSQKSALLKTSFSGSDVRAAEPAASAVPTERPVPQPQGICPNCDDTIPLASVTCPRCQAVFGPNSNWQVKPLAGVGLSGERVKSPTQSGPAGEHA